MEKTRDQIREEQKAYFASIQDENGVDLLQIRANLKLTPEERLLRLERAQRFHAELVRARGLGRKQTHS